MMDSVGVKVGPSFTKMDQKEFRIARCPWTMPSRSRPWISRATSLATTTTRTTSASSRATSPPDDPVGGDRIRGSRRDLVGPRSDLPGPGQAGGPGSKAGTFPVDDPAYALSLMKAGPCWWSVFIGAALVACGGLCINGKGALLPGRSSRRAPLIPVTLRASRPQAALYSSARGVLRRRIFPGGIRWAGYRIPARGLDAGVLLTAIIIFFLAGGFDGCCSCGRCCRAGSTILSGIGDYKVVSTAEREDEYRARIADLNAAGTQATNDRGRRAATSRRKSWEQRTAIAPSGFGATNFDDGHRPPIRGRICARCHEHPVRYGDAQEAEFRDRAEMSRWSSKRNRSSEVRAQLISSHGSSKGYLGFVSAGGTFGAPGAGVMKHSAIPRLFAKCNGRAMSLSPWWKRLLIPRFPSTNRRPSPRIISASPPSTSGRLAGESLRGVPSTVSALSATATRTVRWRAKGGPGRARCRRAADTGSSG